MRLKSHCCEVFDSWAHDLKPQRPEVSDDVWEAFKRSMYDGEFLFNVAREFVSRCQTPLLVVMGGDLHHPQATSRERAAPAPDDMAVSLAPITLTPDEDAGRG